MAEVTFTVHYKKPRKSGLYHLTITVTAPEDGSDIVMLASRKADQLMAKDLAAGWVQYGITQHPPEES